MQLSSLTGWFTTNLPDKPIGGLDREHFWKGIGLHRPGVSIRFRRTFGYAPEDGVTVCPSILMGW
jgi:hypothetical protein